MKKICYILFAFLAVQSASFGQTKKAYIDAAEKAMSNKNYYGALTWYNEALEFNQTDVILIYKSAEAARKFNAYDLAAEKYQLLVDSLGANDFPDAAFYLGQMKQRLGEFQEAQDYYTIYKLEYGGDTTEYSQNVENRLKEVSYALDQLEKEDRSANVSTLENEVNTPYSEFGAIKKGDKVYFTTMRYMEEDPQELPAKSLSKLHILEGDTNQVILGPINDYPNKLVAHTTFSGDGTVIYYNVCEYLNDEDVRCDLVRRPVNEDGSFGELEILEALNIDTATTTQPYLDYNPETGKEVLYFSSDRKGGKGMLDLYMVEINGDGFGEIINLEEINTIENEASPFYHRYSKTLFFSSEGRLGLGGYDVYSVKYADGEFGEVVNAPIPVNSSYHDLYYTLNDDADEALFSSNRDGAMYLDPGQKACCFDIFKIQYDEVIIDLDLLVFDKLTGRDLNGATVHLIDGSSGDTLETATNLDGNDFQFKVLKNKDYVVFAERENYNDELLNFNTREISESTKISKEIYMTTDKTQLDVFTFNKRTQEELEGVQLKVTNETTGDVVYIDVNEMGNDFHIYLENGSKYRIEASKFGFVTETDTVDLTDVSEPTLIERKLYLEVFDIEDYMPVTIYFENDYPNPRSASTETSDTYAALYQDYIANKPRYIKKYTRRLSESEKAFAINQLDGFFEGDVAGGYGKLQRFMRALKKELELGRSLEVALKGYTSPVAETRYNLALGQRRVQSIKNEILNYEGGIFREYVNSGRLILTDISFGEELSPVDVSDSSIDERNSVYSVEAARERKVQIVKISDQ